jgi:hypothetical protein
VLTQLGWRTWSFDPLAHAWTKKQAVLSGVNTGFIDSGREVTFDAAGGRTVFFSDGILATYDAGADAWKVVRSGPNWPPAGTIDGSSTGPLARLYHSLIYDPVNERVVMLGGLARTEKGWQDPGDVWAYEMGTNSWIQLVPPPSK